MSRTLQSECSVALGNHMLKRRMVMKLHGVILVPPVLLCPTKMFWEDERREGVSWVPRSPLKENRCLGLST